MPLKLENVGIAVGDLEATIASSPTIGMHRVAFSVDDLDAALEIAAAHGCHPLRGVASTAICTLIPMCVRLGARGTALVGERSDGLPPSSKSPV